ncbi:MAG: GNAT family N-acetyltransferase [Rhodobacteraceae bacterium]|nr:GNAT family N-acetyltransferase [Paracoccaceae bacterium]
MDTARLTLRALADADWPDLQRIATAPGVARMLYVVTEPWPEAAVRAFIRRWRWQGRLGYRLAVCLRDGPMIGTVGIGQFPVETFYFLDPRITARAMRPRRWAPSSPMCSPALRPSR